MKNKVVDSLIFSYTLGGVLEIWLSQEPYNFYYEKIKNLQYTNDYNLTNILNLLKRQDKQFLKLLPSMLNGEYELFKFNELQDVCEWQEVIFSSSLTGCGLVKQKNYRTSKFSYFSVSYLTSILLNTLFHKENNYKSLFEWSYIVIKLAQLKPFYVKNLETLIIISIWIFRKVGALSLFEEFIKNLLFMWKFEPLLKTNFNNIFYFSISPLYEETTNIQYLKLIAKLLGVKDEKSN